MGSRTVVLSILCILDYTFCTFVNLDFWIWVRTIDKMCQAPYGITLQTKGIFYIAILVDWFKTQNIVKAVLPLMSGHFLLEFQCGQIKHLRVLTSFWWIQDKNCKWTLITLSRQSIDFSVKNKSYSCLNKMRLWWVCGLTAWSVGSLGDMAFSYYLSSAQLGFCGKQTDFNEFKCWELSMRSMNYCTN